MPFPIVDHGSPHMLWSWVGALVTAVVAESMCPTIIEFSGGPIWGWSCSGCRALYGAGGIGGEVGMHGGVSFAPEFVGQRKMRLHLLHCMFCQREPLPCVDISRQDDATSHDGCNQGLDILCVWDGIVTVDCEIATRHSIVE